MLRSVLILFACVTDVRALLPSIRSKRIKTSGRGVVMKATPSEVIQNSIKLGLGDEWSVPKFLDELKHGEIDLVTLLSDEKSLVAVDKHHSTDLIVKENVHLVKVLPQMVGDILIKLNEQHVAYDVYNVAQQGPGFDLSLPLQFVGGYVLFTIALNLIIGRMQQPPPPSNTMGGRNNMLDRLNPFQTQAKELINPEDIDVRFADVAGCDEAKYELSEVVDFLKNPLKYEAAGAKVPRGVLLEGEPGTGKTLMARAVAGEAGVSFLSASGSEFIEMFVGVGAARVRKLFETAEQNSPCVIFIDEIDAVGRQRGAGVNTGNDEREQTLNQILTNMDGFTTTNGIIVLAATNRADILDSALLRPGRFDRKVKVPLPDLQGRKHIFKVHTKNKELAPDVDLNEVATLTSGFSGADLSNLANEAAIMSVRENRTVIDRTALFNAYEKITIGLASATQTADPEIVSLVAHHEIGHALIAKYFEEFFELRKVTINANQGGAGGYTLFTPKEQFMSYATKKFMLANIVVALGGRAAEVELFSQNEKKPTNVAFQNVKNLDITTGASNDLKQADSIARRYISLFGISDDEMLYKDMGNAQPFLGRELGVGGDRTSEYTKELIDKKVTELISDCYKVADNLIQSNREAFYELAATLTEKRVIDASEFANVTLTFH